MHIFQEYVCLDEGDAFYLENEEEVKETINIPPRKSKNPNKQVNCVFYSAWKDFFSSHIRMLMDKGNSSCSTCCDGANENSLAGKHFLNHIIETENPAGKYSCPIVETYLNKNFQCLDKTKEQCGCHKFSNINNENVTSDHVRKLCKSNPTKRQSTNPFVDFQTG